MSIKKIKQIASRVFPMVNIENPFRQSWLNENTYILQRGYVTASEHWSEFIGWAVNNGYVFGQSEIFLYGQRVDETYFTLFDRWFNNVKNKEQ